MEGLPAAAFCLSACPSESRPVALEGPMLCRGTGTGIMLWRRIVELFIKVWHSTQQFPKEQLGSSLLQRRSSIRLECQECVAHLSSISLRGGLCYALGPKRQPAGTSVELVFRQGPRPTAICLRHGHDCYMCLTSTCVRWSACDARKMISTLAAILHWLK
jgi:hypothetical protein